MMNNSNIRPIDGNALLDTLYDNEFQTFCPLDEVSDVIAAAPTLDCEPVRHASWIRQDDTYTRFQCGECKSKNFDRRWVFCPLCGAKMDKEKENA